MVDIGDRVLYIVPGTLKVRPAVVVEVTGEEQGIATLHVFTLPEDVAFSHAWPIAIARDTPPSTHRLGHTWHWPPGAHGTSVQAHS